MTTNMIPGRDIPDPETPETKETGQWINGVWVPTPVTAPQPPPATVVEPTTTDPEGGTGKVVPATTTDTDTTTTDGGGGGSGGGGGDTGGGDTGGGNTATIPTVLLNTENATLVSVVGDGPRRWYVEWMVNGVILRHEVGDDTRAAELGLATPGQPGLGPLESQFATRVTISPYELAQRGGIDAGLVDERLGIGESYQATVDRELRVFGQEDIPDWQRNSPEVMTILSQAAAEGFSPGRTFGLISQTTAFKEQHPFYEQVVGVHQPGASGLDAFSWYVNARDQMRQSIRTYRGITADVSDQTIGEILSRGWDPEEAEDVLVAESVMRQMPGMADQLNALLEYQGSDVRVTEDNLIDLIVGGETDRTPFEVQETINDAIRAQAFANQGIDLSPTLASALGTGEAFETLDPNTAAQSAVEVATNIFRFGQELNAEREGLGRDDLITAMVNGDMSADVQQRLLKFARRRQIEGQGQSVSAYQNAQGRAVIPGLSGL